MLLGWVRCDCAVLGVTKLLCDWTELGVTVLGVTVLGVTGLGVTGLRWV